LSFKQPIFLLKICNFITLQAKKNVTLQEIIAKLQDNLVVKITILNLILQNILNFKLYTLNLILFSMKRVTFALVISLFFVFGLAQNPIDKFSPSSRIFLETEKSRVDTAQISPMFRSATKDNFVSAFVEIVENADLQEIENLGVVIDVVAGNILSCRIPISQLENLAALSEVLRIEIALPVRRKIDRARPAGSVDSVQSGLGLPSAFSGRGVIVGVVDAGFEYGHINFFEKNNSTLRVKRVWNQNSDRKYNSQSAILNAARDSNREYHGTHVTGIAAGNDHNNNFKYYGVAPESDIVMVTYGYSQNETPVTTSIFNGIEYVFKYADSVQKPAVVNLSLGMHTGPHDGTSMFDRACDNILGEGKILVGAAGNEGSDRLHVSKTLNSSADTLKTFMNFLYGSYYDLNYGSADIWSGINQNFGLKIVIINRTNDAVVYESPIVLANGQTERFNINETGARGRVSVSTEINSINSRANAFVEFNFTYGGGGNYELSSNYLVGIKLFSQNGATINAWADNNYSQFSAFGKSGWTHGDSNSSVGEIGGTGKRIISVGAFTTRAGNGQQVNRITTFSSKGPTLDGRVKPDITAPGAQIMSSINSLMQNVTQVADTYNTVDGKRYYYGLAQGTSMSSPFVAGVVALWLQLKPDLTPEDIRVLLEKTSKRDTYTTANIPNNTWGYGKINAWGGIKYLLENEVIIPPSENNIFNFENTLSESGTFSVRFLEADEDVFLQAFTPDGKVVLTQNYGSVSMNEYINYNLPPVYSGNMYFVIVRTKKLPKGDYTRVMIK